MDFGNYILHDRIGRSSASYVFLATVKATGERVVVKRVRPGTVGRGEDGFVRAFFEHARLIAAIEHEHIVKVLDVGTVGTQYFIAREYVPGRDLALTIATAAKMRIPFPPELAIHIFRSVLSAVLHTHSVAEGRTLLHAITPDKVFLGSDGSVKTAFNTTNLSFQQETTDVLDGDFGYLAPEQVMGDELDQRVEIFVAGTMLYELMTGQRLFRGGSDVSVLEKVREAIIYPAPKYHRPDLVPELEAIMLRALARNPADRFPTMQDLIAAVETCPAPARSSDLIPFLERLFSQESS